MTVENDEQVLPETIVKRPDRARHGMRTVARQEKLIELRQRFATEPERLEYRADLAAFLAWVISDGVAECQARRDDGTSIWSDGPLKMLAVYINSLTRLMDAWPKDKERPEAIDLSVYRSKPNE